MANPMKSLFHIIYVISLHFNCFSVTSQQVQPKCIDRTEKWLDCSNLSIEYLKPQTWTKTLNMSLNFFGQGALDVRILSKWSSLQSLDLTYNSITIFIGRGSKLPNLENLNISHNRLFDLKPRMFTNMGKLKVLNLSGNRITLISPSAIMLPSLVDLDMSFNRLTTLRAHYFQGVTSLTRLNLSNNLISSIPSWAFYKCKLVAFLDVSYNRIGRVSEDAFMNSTVLDLLDLSMNSVTRTITELLRTKVTINSLLLNGNTFDDFHAKSAYGVRVRSLEISSVRTLFYISDHSFDSLEILESLKIENNKNLRFISAAAFHNVPDLSYMSLRGNSLFTLDSGVLKNIPKLNYIDLSENSFYCDCSLKWLQRAVLNETLLRHDVTDIKCDANATYNQSHISDLSPLPDLCEPHMEVLNNDRVIFVDLSANLSVKCVSTGHQSPQIVWFTGDNTTQTIDACPSGRICHNNGHLWLRSAHEQDSGTYYCSATNNMGQDAKSIQIKVVKLNVSLVATQISSNFIILHWMIRKGTPRVSTCVFSYQSGESKKKHKIILRNCHHHRFYTLMDLKADMTYTISMYKKHRGHVFKMAAISVTTSSESLMEMLTAHYKFWLLCSLVIVVISCPILISCTVQCVRYFCKMSHKQHSEMTMFMQSESATCFVLDTDDTSLSTSYPNSSDDSQLLM